MLWRLHSRKALLFKELKTVLQIVSVILFLIHWWTSWCCELLRNNVYASQVFSFACRPTKNVKTIPQRSHMEGQQAGKDERTVARFSTISLPVYFSMCFSIFKIAHVTSDFRNKFLYEFVIYVVGSTKRAAPLYHIQEIWGSNSDSQSVYPQALWAPAGNFLKYGHNPFTSHGLASSLYTEQSSNWTL